MLTKEPPIRPVVEHRHLFLQLIVEAVIDAFGINHLLLCLQDEKLNLTSYIFFNRFRLKYTVNKTSHVFLILHDLVYLDVIPLLCSLQCLQVVEGRVVVHQLSSPLGNFLLQG